MTPVTEIISIGDELLYGEIIDSNSQWISAALDKAGIPVIRHTTVGDNEESILKALSEAERNAEIIIITGGLGPTDDDLTRVCLAKFFNCPLTLNKSALNDLEKLFKKVNRPMNEADVSQAILPEYCEKITNRMGTAPAMWFRQHKKVFISMPGVPVEMRNIMKEQVLPRLKVEFTTQPVYHKHIHTVGISESHLAEKIRPWITNLPEHIKLAYLPGLAKVTLRLTAKGDNYDQLKNEVDGEAEKLVQLIEKYIFGYGEDELEAIVGKMLLSQNKTIAVAESCTGGYISHLITGVAGSSAYFRGSVVPYHNELKENFLGVQNKTIEGKGAVSEETVIEMAEGVRKTFGADIGVASSGIAGPGGGTPEKPVGTVWLAYSDGYVTRTKKLQLFKSRKLNIEYTGVAALNLVRLNLMQPVQIN